MVFPPDDVRPFFLLEYKKIGRLSVKKLSIWSSLRSAADKVHAVDRSKRSPGSHGVVSEFELTSRTTANQSCVPPWTVHAGYVPAPGNPKTYAFFDERLLPFARRSGWWGWAVQWNYYIISFRVLVGTAAGHRRKSNLLDPSLLYVYRTYVCITTIRTRGRGPCVFVFTTMVATRVYALLPSLASVIV